MRGLILWGILAAGLVSALALIESDRAGALMRPTSVAALPHGFR